MLGVVLHGDMDVGHTGLRRPGNILTKRHGGLFQIVQMRDLPVPFEKIAQFIHIDKIGGLGGTKAHLKDDLRHGMLAAGRFSDPVSAVEVALLADDDFGSQFLGDAEGIMQIHHRQAAVVPGT